MPQVGTLLYNTVTKRFSSLFVAAIGGAFVIDLVLNKGTDYYWRQHNKGKLWEDIRMANEQ
ncbi:hypothetical protein AB6A40_008290 [Gnathostoma spinigerum]|uniref:Complex III subunit 9 n=1 Tax=Gnathostoma spinigerum TaxID=75299 RepID=A0ABD6EVS7_9BILA